MFAPNLDLSDATSNWFQLKTVIGRANLAFYRNSDYQFTRVYNHATIGLIVGLTFLNVGNSVSDLEYRVFSIFVAAVLPALVSDPFEFGVGKQSSNGFFFFFFLLQIVAQVEPAFIMARGIHLREAASKMYSQEVFAISQFL